MFGQLGKTSLNNMYRGVFFLSTVMMRWAGQGRGHVSPLAASTQHLAQGHAGREECGPRAAWR